MCIRDRYYTHAAVSDFTIVNVSTIIPPGVFEACLQLVAVDDETVEDHELFIVVVETINPSDMVNGTTSIIISDNDGILTMDS